MYNNVRWGEFYRAREAENMGKNLLIFILAGALLGCTTFGRDFNYSAIDKIEPGQTTETEVVAMLGAPQCKKTLDNGIQVYEYAYGKHYPVPQYTDYDYVQVQFYNGIVINKLPRLAVID